MMLNKKTAEALWQDYQFLTKEMLKFLNEQDMDLFYDLLNQRDRMQTLIDQTPDDGFKVSPVGRSLLAETRQDSQAIIEAMQLRMGNSKRQNQISNAYSAVSTTAVSLMNWKR